MIGNIVAAITDGGEAATDFESIATVTVGAGGATPINFTSISSDYQHLQIRLLAKATSGAFQNIIMRFNSDTGSNYNWHILEGVGSGTPTSGSSVNDSSIYMLQDTSGGYAVAVLDILDYKNTNKYTTIRCLSGADLNGSGKVHMWSGAWRNTAAITSISIAHVSNSFDQYSHFALYGIKG